MRFDIHLTDRVHMAVWRRYRDPHWWCAARCLNGVPLEHAAHFPTWCEALEYAIAQIENNHRKG